MKQSILESIGGIEKHRAYPKLDNSPMLPGPDAPDQESNNLPGQGATIEQVGIQADQIQRAAKEDLDLLAALIMPTIFQFSFPPVFKSVWTWLLSYIHQIRIFPQLALGLPRGFGKTTLMKIFIIYCILYTDKRFILIISSTATLAENILSDIIDMLEEPNIKLAFGDWKLGIEKDTQAIKKFGFRGRNIIIAAIGAESSLRGLNIKNTRPDVMLFEDVQSRECADSPVQSESLENWIIGTAMKAKSPMGCMFLFVANMYPTKYSILRKLKSNPTWIKFIAGGILADGTSLWEELQPIKQLIREFQNDLALGKPEIFYSEVLNDENISSNRHIDLSKLPDFKYQEDDIPAGKFIIIDPASDKKDSDAVAIGYFEIHDAVPVLMKVTEECLSPGETIRTALTYALEHNCSLIVIEAQAYQYSLLYWFDFICKQLGIQGIQAVPIYAGITNKNARILKMFRSYLAGEFFVHPECRLEVHTQITQFNSLKRDNDDGILDLLTYSARVIVEFVDYIVADNVIEQQEFNAIEVPEFNSPF